MKPEEIFQVATAILISLGGGSAIVFAFSNWIGKIWAERIMTQERAKFERELAELRMKLERENQESVSKLRTELEIYRDKFLKAHHDKLKTYGTVCEVVAEFLADLNTVQLGQRPEGNALDRFNRGRLRAHGYLAMLAPQPVMDAYDDLINFIFDLLERNPPAAPHEDWREMRRLAYVLMNAIRKDIGVDVSEIEYRGKR